MASIIHNKSTRARSDRRPGDHGSAGADPVAAAPALSAPTPAAASSRATPPTFSTQISSSQPSGRAAAVAGAQAAHPLALAAAGRAPSADQVLFLLLAVDTYLHTPHYFTQLITDR
ncbi:hypothetical protein EVAR_20532_1 [Eumeta japonica]|uniref:Uncharacterized protein n=1 Tax=Eumeta variegata TaxID=151549 RepID=A0A4C1VN28_EUMVA|nr:hypothetical protein EVAR_20532_1 [Eumeta japonica]